MAKSKTKKPEVKVKFEKKCSYDDHCPDCRKEIRSHLEELTKSKRIRHDKMMEISIECPECGREMKCEVIVDFHLHYTGLINPDEK